MSLVQDGINPRNRVADVAATFSDRWYVVVVQKPTVLHICVSHASLSVIIVLALNFLLYQGCLLTNKIKQPQKILQNFYFPFLMLYCLQPFALIRCSVLSSSPLNSGNTLLNLQLYLVLFSNFLYFISFLFLLAVVLCSWQKNIKRNGV